MHTSVDRVGRSLLCAVPLVLVGCNSNRCPESGSVGFFRDAPLPTLCQSDELEFSPKTAVLKQRTAEAGVTDASGGSAGTGSLPGGAGGSAEVGAGEDSLAMAIYVHDENGRPIDTVNVDVWICEDPMALVQLAPSGKECTAVSPSRLHCATTPSGIAQFSLARAQKGSGQAKLCATSGTRAAEATISVTGDGDVRPTLEAITKMGYGDGQGLSCGPVACNAATRQVAVALAAVDAAGASTFGGTQTASVQLNTLSGAGAWLSSDIHCTAPPVDTLPVTLDESGKARPFFVCAGLQRSENVLVATLPGCGSAQLSLSVPVVPVTASLSRRQITNVAGMGGQLPPVVVDVTDCQGNPMQGLTFSLADGSRTTTMVTDSLGRASVASEASTLTLGITDPVSPRVMVAECSIKETP